MLNFVGIRSANESLAYSYVVMLPINSSPLPQNAATLRSHHLNILFKDHLPPIPVS